MSGLVGVLSLDGAPVDPALLERLTHYLAFRGPDAQSTWHSPEIGLGHALLRTTLEAAQERQPLTLDNQVWITADCRVDGRDELRRALASAGRAPEAAAPDPELILYAYRAWGEACLDHLIGDFAFAIWDAPRRRLFCARDQFGVVPFFYARLPGALLFSNTLNALRLHPLVPDDLNEQALADYVLLDGNQDPATTSFRAIQRLPAAHCLTWAGGELRVRAYWSPASEPEAARRPGADLVAEFRQTFEEAVADRLRLEHIFTQLSGGMDSTSVALTAAGLRDRTGIPAEIRAHTVVFKHLMHDEEGDYASLVAAAARIRHEVRVLDEPTPGEVDELRYIPPEPSALPRSGPDSPEMHAALAFSRVMLTGYGGDPLLKFSTDYPLSLIQRLRWGRLAQEYWQAWLQLGRRPSLHLRSRLRRSGVRMPRPLPAWINPELARRYQLSERWQQRYFPARRPDARDAMVTDAYWSNLLTRMDPGSTGTPLRLRHPFFDLRLWRCVKGVPPMAWLVSKELLRAAMRDIMPVAVLRRPKTPLANHRFHSQALQQAIPARWLQYAMADELEPFVDRQRLLAALQAPAQQSGFDYTILMQPLSLAYWLRHQARPT